MKHINVYVQLQVHVHVHVLQLGVQSQTDGSEHVKQIMLHDTADKSTYVALSRDCLIS